MVFTPRHCARYHLSSTAFQVIVPWKKGWLILVGPGSAVCYFRWNDVYRSDCETDNDVLDHLVGHRGQFWRKRKKARGSTNSLMV